MRQRPGPRKPLPPLDAPTLDAIAMRYLERFQTSRARLIRLLKTKVRLRGWQQDAPPPDYDAIADRFVDLGYVNDLAFAESRSRSLARRGLGASRIRQTLRHSGIEEAHQQTALGAQDEVASAIAFARKKRLGPYGPPPATPEARRRAYAAMARAGHPPKLIRAILSAATEADLPESGEDGV